MKVNNVFQNRQVSNRKRIVRVNGMKILLMIFSLLVSVCSVHGAQLPGYTKHQTRGGVTLYYKLSDFGVDFVVENNRKKAVSVTIKKVSANWNDGDRLTKNIVIDYVEAGETATARYKHADQRIKVKGGWSSADWEWVDY